MMMIMTLNGLITLIYRAIHGIIKYNLNIAAYSETAGADKLQAVRQNVISAGAENTLQNP